MHEKIRIDKNAPTPHTPHPHPTPHRTQYYNTDLQPVQSAPSSPYYILVFLTFSMFLIQMHRSLFPVVHLVLHRGHHQLHNGPTNTRSGNIVEVIATRQNNETKQQDKATRQSNKTKQQDKATRQSNETKDNTYHNFKYV